MLRKFAALILVAVSQSAFSQWEPIPARIQIAAFRAAVPKEPSSVVICLRVNGEDPEESVKSSIETDRLLVVASECSAASNVLEGGTHAATGRDAVFYGLSGLRMYSEDLLQLTFTTYVNGRHGTAEIFTMSRIEGSWTVVGREGKWVSMAQQDAQADTGELLAMIQSLRRGSRLAQR